MKSFLEEIAERLIRDYGSGTGKVSLVFPNKRAGLFFIRELSTKVTRPLWSPMIFSLEEFIYALSGRQPADRLTLILSLYQAYSRACGIEETFDRFFFWGDILLNDFDETDQYLVNPDQVFSSVRDLKEIDAEFPFLTGEQKDIIREFWGRLSGKDSDFKEGFLKFWRSLPAIYRSFHEILNRKGYFYRGLIYRDLTKQVTDGQLKWEGGPVIFAGFNALTAAEETIIRWFVGNGIGTLVWDTDSFYLNNPLHEAGLFQRRYLHDGDFGGTFPRPVPANIRNNSLEVETVATSSDTAQARWAGDKILELHRQGLMNRPEKTVIVMPDETMVIPLLYALPAEADRINITIAYPVRSAPLYSFFEWVLELHENRRDSSVGTWFNHAQVLPLLSHPVIRSSSGEKAGDLAQKIRQENKIYIPASYLTQGDGSLLDEVFKRVKDDAGIPEYLTGLILSMRNAGSANAYDDEIHYFFYRLFRRLKETFTAGEVPVSFAMLKKLFRQLSRSERVSFSGEPLEGLQIMGIMETRNLDFDHVILLNANEGSTAQATSRARPRTTSSHGAGSATITTA